MAEKPIQKNHLIQDLLKSNAFRFKENVLWTTSNTDKFKRTFIKFNFINYAMNQEGEGGREGTSNLHTRVVHDTNN